MGVIFIAWAPMALAERFVPDDVDWMHPLYQTSFEDQAELSHWTLEGGRRIAIESGTLTLQSDAGEDTKPTPEGDHLVAWLKQEVPADFLLEFTFQPKKRREGLAIVFFNARGEGGRDIFDKSLARRNGLFKQYHSGDIDCYHISYWAGDRGKSHLRKNRGFHLVAEGRDLIESAPAEAWQTIRIYKRGGAIRMTVDDELALTWDDDGQRYGPVHDHSGWIGLRQMSHTDSARYGKLAIYPLK